MKILTSILCLLVFFSFIHAESTITLDDLIQNHVKAIGGKKAIENVKSLRYKLEITEPKFTVDGVYVADRDMHMRIDISKDGKVVYIEAFNGKSGWEARSVDGARNDSTAEGSAGLWHGIVMPDKLFGLHEMESAGSKVSLEGREVVDGINYYVIKFTLKDGYAIHYYVNPENWRIERSRDVAALHPDVDASKQSFETRYSDFRMQDGVLRSFRSEKFDLNSGEKVQTTVIQSIETNPKLDPKIFEKM
jgi:hypothetical protein